MYSKMPTDKYTKMMELEYHLHGIKMVIDWGRMKNLQKESTI